MRLRTISLKVGVAQIEHHVFLFMIASTGSFTQVSNAPRDGVGLLSWKPPFSRLYGRIESTLLLLEIQVKGASSWTSIF